MTGATMFYLLLIIPHLVALTALLGYAVRSAPRAVSAEPGGEDHGSEGELRPPPGPSPVGHPAAGPPLPSAAAPGRRLRDTERLADLHRRRPRREHPERPPRPAPKPSGTENS